MPCANPITPAQARRIAKVLPFSLARSTRRLFLLADGSQHRAPSDRHVTNPGAAARSTPSRTQRHASTTDSPRPGTERALLRRAPAADIKSAARSSSYLAEILSATEIVTCDSRDWRRRPLKLQSGKADATIYRSAGRDPCSGACFPAGTDLTDRHPPDVKFLTAQRNLGAGSIRARFPKTSEGAFVSRNGLRSRDLAMSARRGSRSRLITFAIKAT